MHTAFAAAFIALGLVQSAVAGQHSSHAQDPNLTPIEEEARTATIALASITQNKCNNVPPRIATSFHNSFLTWRVEQGITQERAQFIADKVRSDHVRYRCEDIPTVMNQVSKSWTGSR